MTIKISRLEIGCHRRKCPRLRLSNRKIKTIPSGNTIPMNPLVSTLRAQAAAKPQAVAREGCGCSSEIQNSSMARLSHKQTITSGRMIWL
jgi:hypothetical protein